MHDKPNCISPSQQIVFLLATVQEWQRRTILQGLELAPLEGSTVWIQLLNNPVFLLKPLSVSIVPLPSSSASSSAVQEVAG